MAGSSPAMTTECGFSIGAPLAATRDALFRGGAVVVAPGHQLVPAVGLHELGPAAVEIARRLLAGAHIGDVDDLARDPKPLPFEIFDRGADALLVSVGMAARDRAAAGGMRVIPVFHVVLLGHAARAGIADV